MRADGANARGDRLLLTPAGDGPGARSRLSFEESDRARLEGQAFSGAVRRSDGFQLAFSMVRSSDLRLLPLAWLARTVALRAGEPCLGK